MSRNHNEPNFSLKDELFNKRKVAYLAKQLQHADQAFLHDAFVTSVMSKLRELELKARIGHIADCLEQYLPKEFEVATNVIVRSLPEPLDPTKTDDDFGDFIFAPYGEFVVRHGLSKKHLKRSLATLRELTMRFSMEDAIRAFINTYPEETFSELQKWTKDDNYHVRRLVSEGTRALLPWSGRLKTDPLKPLPLLDVLHADPARYVTRSVANHLNDIAKIDPDKAVAVLKQWQREDKQTEKELGWMTKHALRTLVKQGHPEALKLLGYQLKPKIAVSEIAVNKKRVKVGEALEFSFTVSAAQEEKLLIDYVIDFVKANGKTQPKVHKIKSVLLTAGESHEITKRHPFRAGATTLTFYPGVHTVTLQINGRRYSRADFTLET